MPEGHTLFRLARELRGALRRPRRVASAARRAGSPSPPRWSTGRVLVGAESYGKHLFVDFEQDRLVHVHLGLYGKFDLHDGPAAEPPVGQVRLRLVADGDADRPRRTATCAAPRRASC